MRWQRLLPAHDTFFRHVNSDVTPTHWRLTYVAFFKHDGGATSQVLAAVTKLGAAAAWHIRSLSWKTFVGFAPQEKNKHEFACLFMHNMFSFISIAIFDVGVIICFSTYHIVMIPTRDTNCHAACDVRDRHVRICFCAELHIVLRGWASTTASKIRQHMLPFRWVGWFCRLKSQNRGSYKYFKKKQQPKHSAVTIKPTLSWCVSGHPAVFYF